VKKGVQALSISEKSDDFLRLVNLKTYYDVSKGFIKKTQIFVKAVDDVSMTIRYGETFGLVGESGCGKSTLGRTILRLEKATSGEVHYLGRNILSLAPNEMRTMRQEMQMIFQDPYSSLNPKMTVSQIVGEPLLVHNLAHGKERAKRVYELLDLVGLRSYHAKRYPHEFSGGQRQRIGVARALAVNPKLIICDEAVSALDVSIQAQILNLLSRLQKELKLTYIFIAHGLATVKHISNRVGVMYLGKIVELANSDDIYLNPLHPYSKALISAIPEPNPENVKKRVILTGDVPSPVNPPSGCRFHTRCSYCNEKCKTDEPELKEMLPGHLVACHLL